MTIILENKDIRATIAEHGAELQSVINKNADLEYIWVGDPKYWGRHASNLFPIVGRLRGDQYEVNGETYYMNQHGFARNMDFAVAEQTDRHVVLRLTESESTLRVYPYRFIFEISYTLTDENKIQIAYQVTNPDEKESLFFSVGGHPGFNLPLDGGKFSDYYISFEPEKVYDRVRLVGPYANPEHPSDFNTKLPLRMLQEDYHDDAIVLRLERQPITLLLARLANQHGIKMTIDNAQYVGIWTPAGKNAPFIALEPWWGIADTIDATGKLTDKYGINIVAAGDSFTGSYSIQFF